MFPSDRELCATHDFLVEISFVNNRRACSLTTDRCLTGLVTAIEKEEGEPSGTPYIIHSNDNDKDNLQDENEYGPIQDRKFFFFPSNTNLPHQKWIQSGKAEQLEVWQVARATSAAESYFELMKIEDSNDGLFKCYFDGGFSYHTNPTRAGKKVSRIFMELTVNPFFSVGTVNPQKRKESQFFFQSS